MALLDTFTAIQWVLCKRFYQQQQQQQQQQEQELKYGCRGCFFLRIRLELSPQPLHHTKLRHHISTSGRAGGGDGAGWSKSCGDIWSTGTSAASRPRKRLVGMCLAPGMVFVCLGWFLRAPCIAGIPLHGLEWIPVSCKKHPQSLFHSHSIKANSAEQGISRISEN